MTHYGQTPAQAERQRVAELHRLVKFKSRPTPADNSLGPQMVDFFHKSIARRQTKLSKIAEAWAAIIPAMICDHCSLESLTRGTLTVIVDSSPHLYELRQLLLAGLQDQLLLACKATGLRKITPKLGKWYEAKEEGERRVRFK